MRYNRTTPAFKAINDAILGWELRARARADGSHLCLPLDIRPDLAGEQLAEDLAAQVRDVHRLLGEYA